MHKCNPVTTYMRERVWCFFKKRCNQKICDQCNTKNKQQNNKRNGANKKTERLRRGQAELRKKVEKRDHDLATKDEGNKMHQELSKKS